MDMAESTVGDVTDSESDQFTSRPPSPNIEEQSLLSELKDRVPPPTPLSGSLNGKSHSGMLPTEDSSSPPLVTASSPHSSVIEENGAAMTDQEPPPGDPSCPIKGMYRLLDLITEQGKNCLVDKIVVAQESLQAFINALSPGAHSSITTVNFKTLDELLLKPIGVYGSKEEIVRFLRETGSVDVEMERKMLIPDRDYAPRGAEPILRSGLYIIRTSTSAIAEQTYVLYWPEDATWDDRAKSTVQHNRVMFMRYLTKLCDQLVCLLSAEHSQAIVWGDSDKVDDLDDLSLDSENDDSELLIDFIVEKRDKQDESVMVRQGFTMDSSHLVRPPNTPIDKSFLSPRLLHGETTQGFMTAQIKPARAILEPFSHDNLSARQVRLLFEDDVVLCLSENMDDKALRILMRTMELGTRFPKEYEAWEKRRIEIEKRFQKTIKQRQEESHEALQKQSGDLESKVREAVIDKILKAFPDLRRDGFSPGSTSVPMNSIPVAATGAESLPLEVASGGTAGTLYDVFAIYPKAESMFLDTISPENIDNGIKGTDFYFKKERLLIFLHLLKNFPNLNARQTLSLRDAVLDNMDNTNALKLLRSFFKGEKTKWYSVLWRGRDALPREEAMWKNAKDYNSSLSYSRFLSYAMTFPEANLVHDAAVKSVEAAYTCLRTHLDSQAAAISHKILSIQKEDHNEKVRREVEKEEQDELKASRIEFVRKVEGLCRERYISGTIIHIDMFKMDPKKWPQKTTDSYIICGRKPLQGQEIEYSVHTLRLQADERHNLQLDPTYVPTPVLNEQLSQSFHVPSETVVKYAHLLEGDHILLCLVNSQGNFVIFLDHLSRMDSAILSRSYAKYFHKNKVGEKCLFTFDESKRLLAVYASAKMQLHMYQFDEELKFLRGFGAPINLLPFYDEGASITHACLVHGNEEIVFIDSNAQARIFSLKNLQPRPTSLQLPQIPRAIYSAPDGSCLLVSQEADGGRTMTAYHWSTFVSNSGILVTIPNFPVDLDGAVLTSIVNRRNIYLIGLDLDGGSCRSVVLDIPRKPAGFKFHGGPPKVSSRHGKQTDHNCLIDCHRDVWTRFPVVPEVRRHTITSSSQRQQKALMFVTDDHRRPFSSHFSDIISIFEKTSCKPTGSELKSIVVSARSLSSFTQEFLSSPDWPISRFRTGEWLADLLCLIPINIAITRKNRFVPLKDGIVSPQLEDSVRGPILGASMNRIVDSLTLGWYESIFQSYCVSKPVKVVSSVGEQSVGKSFTLDHLMDTSFGGSTLDTTEGVWMSVSPTEDALIVALDFQGIHNSKRSAEEDMLIVLFGTAISNLVLFRNDFASTRDIGSLFQSFQSSSSVLDPASHPSLFQSTLVVIIKDVIDTDKAEVIERSALEFQQLVQDELDANFITRLHSGKLQIIPWPVIGSRAFYRLFSAVKKKLDQQKASHQTAGEFLYNLKMLMAKLNANNWGTMSRTTAAHRASALLTIVPVALQTGYSEVFPEHEPLKSFDTDLVIEAKDTKSQFLLAGTDTPEADREHHLSMLRDSWHQSASRQQVDDTKWISDLEQYLTELVDLRVAHVDKWLKLNTQGFQAENARKEELRKAFNSAVIDLRASVRFCRSKCATCDLFCIKSRFHESNHDCLTSHKCIRNCAFCDTKVLAVKACGQIAGHKGDHMCRVDAHPCGQRCGLSGNHGCVDKCAKTVSHKGDHVCSAPVHMCGRPCDLVDVKLLDGKSFVCPGLCNTSMSEEHKVHTCERRLCPISCQLCKRLCSGDHLHGLSPNENHLCGQEHPCGALCSADGICRIDTTPVPIEATSTEKDDTIQHTKIIQTAKRLGCIKIIEPGSIGHEGPHIHTNDKRQFHFCESRCEGCGYICTLPFGHSRPEHNTSHGPVLQTRWAVESPKGGCVESGGLRLNEDTPHRPCNLVCSDLGRHVHIDYCKGYPHDDPELLHIYESMDPNPDQAKDWVTHSLYWRRMGFKDPYSSDDQATFAKCDATCPDPEHTVEVGGANALPSRCTLPMLHPPMDAASTPVGLGYMSNDGHYFECENPIVVRHAFHIIFVVDRSESMSKEDIQPPPDSSGIERIKATADNRLGAVFSTLYSFWIQREAAVNRNSVKGIDRKDAYSLIFFNDEQSMPIEYDFTSSPDQLLTAALRFRAHGDTDFSGAIKKAQTVMTSHWSSERTTIVIFLSAGEDDVNNEAIYDLCRDAVRQGRPLSFHAVSFGQDSTSSSLRKMAQIALEVQYTAPHDPLLPAEAKIPSSYTEALDTVRLTVPVLRNARSLRKPRGFLFPTN